MDLFKRYSDDAGKVHEQYTELAQFIDIDVSDIDIESVQRNSATLGLFVFLKIAELQEENKALKQECKGFEERLEYLEQWERKSTAY
jgi:FtsZ-binding cell division protein ZapB